jgi:TonB family protein
MEAVTSVLLERARHEQGLPRMVTASLAAHIVLVVLIVTVPVFKGGPRVSDLRDVMTISLGGAPGPNAGGMTMMGSPPAAPTPVAPRLEVKPPVPIAPPAARAPAMTMPSATRTVKALPKPAAAVVSPEEPTRPGRAPQAAVAASAGQSFNPNRGMGFGGLSTGGGVGGGSYLDVANFCCPDYLVTMLQLVQGNWSARQAVGGEALVGFRIQRDGRLTDIELERSSGFPALDLTAQRALFLTQRVPPLPQAFPDDHLTVHLRFEYRR